MYTLPDWLHLDTQEVASFVASRISTTIVYLNGTRRWFLSQNKDWSEYAKITAKAHREVSQLFYEHGIYTLVQPVLGYDLLDRGRNYLKLAVEQGLTEMTMPDYQDWYRQNGIQVIFYGNWLSALEDIGFSKIAESLQEIMERTFRNSRYRLFIGVFADGGLDQIVEQAKSVTRWEELIERYYHQYVPPIDLVVGSGQPAVWDIPLLNVNKASMYFLQAPTFCLNKETLRCILYDHLHTRVNDDTLYDNLTMEDWSNYTVLGIGQFTRKGWVAA